MRSFLIVAAVVGTLFSVGVAQADDCHPQQSTMTTYDANGYAYNDGYGYNPYLAPPVLPVRYIAPPAPIVYGRAPYYRSYRHPMRVSYPQYRGGRRW